VCDIPTLKVGDTKTNFAICYEVYTVADYFALSPLVKIALDTLANDFDYKLGLIQLQYQSSVDWLPELFEAIRLVYADTPLPDNSLTPIRAAFVSFVHTARFYFMQNAEFCAFLDEEAPVFALDIFRAMRTAGDFITHTPDPFCIFCKTRPSTRRDKGYYTHMAPEVLKLMACCSACVTKRDLPSGLENWYGKKGGAA
jgi:hypothetical protein